ncbi:MAG: PD40 domain-containing protein [Flavobacteriia bacterium]|nr:PD40 domain-containing protein [Flavobacteriia bacterium]
MKYLFLTLLTFVFAACGVAQKPYSTTNKKAISYYEEAAKNPSSPNPKTYLADYTIGIENLKKALEKDSNFLEAHLFIASLYEYANNNEEAVKHYKRAVAINPNYPSTGTTYYFLAACQQVIEYFPTITVDGKTLLFTRRIKDDRAPIDQMQEDFYVTQLINNRWANAVPMPTNINTILNEGAPTLAPDGRTLIFVACADPMNPTDYGQGRSGKGSCDLFYTKKIGKNWIDPYNAKGGLNTMLWESQPSLSSDGKTIYFVRRISKKGEPKNSDIYVSRLLSDGTTWGPAERLPSNINTPMEEESVFIHPDGKTLYFASRGLIGMGGSDLYVSRMNPDGSWSNPINLGYPINTNGDENSLMVGPDGEIAFFASDREGGFGDLDIYYFEMPEKMKPTKTLYFEGLVFDALTRKPIPGKFQLIDLKTGKEVIISEADKVTGEFMVALPVNNDYALNVNYPGYNFFSQNFNMTNPEGLEAIHMDVPMVPISSELPTVLDNVFFDLGRATLRPESSVELNKLRDYLVLNPTLKIELGGHTDTRGDAAENMTLSSNRAKAVYDYLITQGITVDRLAYKGYGETVNRISDAEIAKLATEKEKEAAHQKNRRTEYKIIK